MTDMELALCTLGMIVGTALPRALPMTLLADRAMPDKVQRWLGFVPAGILAALVAPEVFLVNGALDISLHNVFLLASVPSFLTAWKTKSLFATLAAGMLSVALLRLGGLG